MALEFGIFDHLERRHDVPLDQQYRERLDLVEQADRGGIYGYHVAEHHHSPLCLAPNQAVYLAAVAQRTQRLRFGPLVYVLPLHNPIRLIEEACMVDQMSGGRFQIGVGRGTGGGTEFSMWGGDSEENDRRFEETLEVLLKGLQSEFLSHDGEFYQYRDLWMELRPKQQPHPPFWYAGNAERAASWGMNFIGAGRIDRFAETAKMYRETWQRAQESGAAEVLPLAEPLYGTMKHTYIADTDEEAVERASRAYEAYRRNFAKPTPPAAAGDGQSTSAEWNEAAKRSIWMRDQANEVSRTSGPGSAPYDRMLAGESIIAGSPSTVREYVERYHEQAGATYWVSSFQWGDLTHDEASRSLEAFTSEVMPTVR